MFPKKLPWSPVQSTILKSWPRPQSKEINITQCESVEWESRMAQASTHSARRQTDGKKISNTCRLNNSESVVWATWNHRNSTGSVTVWRFAQPYNAGDLCTWPQITISFHRQWWMGISERRERKLQEQQKEEASQICQSCNDQGASPWHGYQGQRSVDKLSRGI